MTLVRSGRRWKYISPLWASEAILTLAVMPLTGREPRHQNNFNHESTSDLLGPHGSRKYQAIASAEHGSPSHGLLQGIDRESFESDHISTRHHTFGQETRQPPLYSPTTSSVLSTNRISSRHKIVSYSIIRLVTYNNTIKHSR